jgi:hypothetical protein
MSEVLGMVAPVTNPTPNRRMFHRVHPDRAPTTQRARMETAQKLATAGDLEGMNEVLRDIEQIGADAERARAFIAEHEPEPEPAVVVRVIGRA